ncbi:heparan-alpha-glucosaminide N-acetyltransferase domain-containing protein [Capnocytophaga sp. oral taxon 878]|uniref:heparan-alpha-glucosaminide N-acetyltransferase domain-containing protein n=1 Tax=Capnocytophaga sp. oral taxon 878 TaxID=1316596 RepID=UPI000D04764A|nr:heparan-alpha-glucosaminide N-acetyltransferase domain-containing protein [Capnocytophaga sp. oral taxon 878]AVM49570.1 hypothetical protein C4H12_03310 [Capnocytophaga sp. oral taxon 878]
MKQRLIFIDVIRAYAICMMLQGHFITALLAEPYCDENNIYYHIWHYFTGITAPVFLTISGFIFTFLLIREGERSGIGLKNPRVIKGFHRGIMLIAVACLLRKSIFFVDILHCIGLALIIMVGIYLLIGKHVRHVLPIVLISITLLLFIFNETYNQYEYSWLPEVIANYLPHKNNTNFFTIFPWLGFVTLGGFIGSMFYYNHKAKHLYLIFTILLIVFGCIFHFQFHTFHFLYELTGWEHFDTLSRKGFLFLRTGDMLWTFAVFVMLRNILTAPFLQRIGQNTLSIYIIHCLVLNQVIPMFNLDFFFHKSLNPIQAIIGAIFFVVGVVVLSFYYHKIYKYIKERYFAESMSRKMVYKLFTVLFISFFSFIITNAIYTLSGEDYSAVVSYSILYYLLPAAFVASILLFLKKRSLFWIPYSILCFYILTEGFINGWNNPLRSIYLLVAITVGYGILGVLITFYFKRLREKKSYLPK